MTKDKSLTKRLEALGFPLFEAKDNEDANLALADMVKAGELRLWEGFPVVLANSAERGLFDYDKAKERLPRLYKEYLGSLVAMSLALYRALGARFSWADTLYSALSPERKREFRTFLRLLKKGADLKVAGQSMSGQRLKSTFRNYFTKVSSGFSELLAAKEELGLEYALSQVFSPKQKELFLKKLKGEKLTKTENEYFSRAVKKKALALANTELHRLSQKLLE